MPLYKTCGRCGAHLDHGEKCDCGRIRPVYNREERMSILENTLHDLRRVKSDLEDELAYVEEDMERAQSEIDALLAYVEGA